MYERIPSLDNSAPVAVEIRSPVNFTTQTIVPPLLSTAYTMFGYAAIFLY